MTDVSIAIVTCHSALVLDALTHRRLTVELR